MKKDEHAIQDLQVCMILMLSPLILLPTLRSLQSGLVASPTLVHDFKTALADGQAQVETFLQERVFTKIKPFTEIIHRNKRQNFTSEQISIPSGAPMKVAQMEKLGLAALTYGAIRYYQT